MNQSLLELYVRLDALYQDIHVICRNCPDHDCEGYVWLLEDEARLLQSCGTPIITINGHIRFIHSFEEEDGRIIVDKPKPPCRLRKNGLCSVYDSRPLVCRMYPVGLVTVEEQVMLVLHRDCKFSRELAGSEKESFIRRMLDILESASPELLDEIIQTYREVDAISAFPEGPNSYEILALLRENTR